MSWQPIETAPKDGTRILAFGKTAAEIGGPSTFPQIEAASFCGESDYPGFEWEIAGGGYANWMAPTHWMPLPLPPKEGGEA